MRPSSIIISMYKEIRDGGPRYDWPMAVAIKRLKLLFTRPTTPP